MGKSTEHVTEIVVRCLEEYQQFGEASLRQACANHPDLANRINDAARAMRELLEVAVTADQTVPEFVWTGKTIGKYQVGEQLGRGGMGVVYRAFDPQLKRLVAIKVLNAPLVSHSPALARFQREGQALAQTKHQNIVPIHEVGSTTDGLPFFAMGLVEGEDLQTILERISEKQKKGVALQGMQLAPGTHDPEVTGKRIGRVSRSYIEAVVRLFIKLAGAIQHANEAGVIHRDVKPGNILLDGQGEPFLVDFGIARSVEQEGATLTGEALGTPAYMAPEQVVVGRQVDSRTDVYSLGATLYHCITLLCPFRGDSNHQVLHLVTKQEPLAPRKANPDIPRDLETICQKCLEKDPARRYQCAGELQADLERHLAFLPVLARPLGPTARLGRWVRRNPLLSLVVILVAMLAVGGPFGYIIHLQTVTEEVSRERDETYKQKMLATQESGKAFYRLGRLSAQRGDWKKALANYQLAGEKEFRDPILLAIGRIEALWGGLDYGAAHDELAALCAIEDKGEYRSRILLMQGMYRKNRWRNAEAGLDLVAHALEIGGLSRADEAMAHAILAKTIPSALQYVEEARRHDPFNRQANELYGVLLLVTNQLEKAQAFATFMTTTYPDDPSSLFFDYFLQAIANKPASFAATALKKLKAVDPFYAGIAQTMSGLFQTLNVVMTDAIVGVEAEQKTINLKVLLPVTLQVVAALQQTRGSADREVVINLHPVLVREFSIFFKNALKMLNPGKYNQDLSDIFQAAAKNTKEGTFLFLLGLTHYIGGRLAQAEAALTMSLKWSSTVVFRRTILAYQATIQTIRFKEIRALNRGRAQRYIQTIKKTFNALLAERGFAPRHYRHFINCAFEFRDLALCLEMACRWCREFPKDKAGKDARNWIIHRIKERAQPK